MIPDIYMSEAALMEHIRILCFDLRLPAFHVYDARRCWGPGFPDLVIVGPSGILYREVKDRTNSIRPEQRKWGSDITRGGGNWAVWRPVDLVNGTIATQLVRIAGVAKEAAL